MFEDLKILAIFTLIVSCITAFILIVFRHDAFDILDGQITTARKVVTFIIAIVLFIDITFLTFFGC